MVFTEVEKVMVIAIGGFEIMALYCYGWWGVVPVYFGHAPMCPVFEDL
jgi:hypothetical protein